MSKLRALTRASLLIVAVTVSCSSSDQGVIDKAVSATLAAAQPATAAPIGTSTTEPVPTDTPAPEPTPAPTATPTPVPTATPTPVPDPVSRISALSASDFSVADIRAWTEAAVLNISLPTPDILGVIWSIGTEIGPTGELGSPFTKYTEIKPASVLSELANSVDTWIDNSGCDADSYRAYENIELKQKIRVWIEGSYDAATAPYPCGDSRIAVVGANSSQSYDTIRKIYVHETYHTLQPTLWDGCQTMGMVGGYYQPIDEPDREAKFEAARWLAEGTAEYFAHFTVAQIKGATNATQTMLAAANSVSNESTDINNDVAVSGAAAVRLLIEREVITEDQVISATLFESCDWVDTFASDVPEVIHAKANWHQIENVGGTWGFKTAALQ